MSQTEDDITPPTNQKKLYRLPKQGMIAGVVAGLADYFSMDVTVLRVLFVVALFATGGFLILPYLIAAVIMPEPGKDSVKGGDVGAKIESLATEMKASGSASKARNWFGIGLVVLGVWLLIGVFWPRWLNIGWDVLLPSLLILAGLLFLVKGKR